jgi:hypothetical protein
MILEHLLPNLAADNSQFVCGKANLLIITNREASVYFLLTSHMGYRFVLVASHDAGLRLHVSDANFQIDAFLEGGGA